MPETNTPPSAPAHLDLKYPVTVDGLKVDHLDLRRPKVRDLLHAAKQGGTDAEQEISQFASLAGVAPGVIEALDMADYLAIQKIVKNFLS